MAVALRHSVPAAFLVALSITFNFLPPYSFGYQWLPHMPSFPSLHRHSCNFAALVHSSGPGRGVTPPAADSVSFHISRKCNEKRISLARRCRADAVLRSLSSSAHGHVRFKFMVSKWNMNQKQSSRLRVCLERSFNSIWSLERWRVACFPCIAVFGYNTKAK